MALRTWLVMVLVSVLLGACAPSPRPAPVSPPRDASSVSKPLPRVAPIQRHVRPQTHRVQRGENLSLIAFQYKTTYRELARWNHIAAPYVIYPGQVLRLRAPLVGSPPVSQRRTPVAAKPTAKPTGKKPQPARAAKPAPKPPAPSRPPVVASKPAPAAAVRNVPTVNIDKTRKLSWAWPARGKLVGRWSSKALMRGIRVSGRPGQAVRAAEAGVVVYSGNGLAGYGNLVIVQHDPNWLSAYGYNRSLTVSEGQMVSRGQPIAELGVSPDGKPVLYFEIRRNGDAVNPLPLLPRS